MFCADNYDLKDTFLNYLSQNKLLLNRFNWLIEFAIEELTTYLLSKYIFFNETL